MAHYWFKADLARICVALQKDKSSPREIASKAKDAGSVSDVILNTYFSAAVGNEQAEKMKHFCLSRFEEAIEQMEKKYPEKSNEALRCVIGDQEDKSDAGYVPLIFNYESGGSSFLRNALPAIN